MDGISSAPRNVRVECTHDPRTHEPIVKAKWDDPEDPQGMITEYAVVLHGNASYHDEHGGLLSDHVGPINKTVMVTNPRSIEFTKQPPNTHLSVRYGVGILDCSQSASSLY